MTVLCYLATLLPSDYRHLLKIFLWLWLATLLPSHYRPFASCHVPTAPGFCLSPVDRDRTRVIVLSVLSILDQIELLNKKYIYFLLRWNLTFPLSPRLVPLTSEQFQDLGHRLLAFIYYLGRTWASEKYIQVFEIIKTSISSTTK